MSDGHAGQDVADALLFLLSCWMLMLSQINDGMLNKAGPVLRQINGSKRRICHETLLTADGESDVFFKVFLTNRSITRGFKDFLLKV